MFDIGNRRDRDVDVVPTSMSAIFSDTERKALGYFAPELEVGGWCKMASGCMETSSRQ